MQELTPEEIRHPKPWAPFSPEWTRLRLGLVEQRLRFFVSARHQYLTPFVTSPDPFTRLVTVTMLPDLGLPLGELSVILRSVRLWDPHNTVRAAAGYYLTPVREALMWERFERQFEEAEQ